MLLLVKKLKNKLVLAEGFIDIFGLFIEFSIRSFSFPFLAVFLSVGEVYTLKGTAYRE